MSLIAHIVIIGFSAIASIVVVRLISKRNRRK